MRVIGMRMGRVMVAVAMCVAIPVMIVVVVAVVMVAVAVLMIVIVTMMVVVVMIAMMMVMMSVAMVMIMVMPVTGIGADALHVMVMAGLRQADFRLEADDLLAILAHLAIHVVLTVENLAHAVGEGIEHQGVIVEILRLQELDLRMPLGHLVRYAVDALHQHAREQEVREDDDAAVAQLHRMLGQPHRVG